jgi:hypothetical protein
VRAAEQSHLGLCFQKWIPLPQVLCQVLTIFVSLNITDKRKKIEVVSTNINTENNFRDAAIR